MMHYPRTIANLIWSLSTNTIPLFFLSYKAQQSTMTRFRLGRVSFDYPFSVGAIVSRSSFGYETSAIVACENRVEKQRLEEC